MASSTKPIPDGYQTITPAITCRDARKEIEFLKAALGAEVRHVMTTPGSEHVMHAERFEIPAELARAVADVRSAGGRVWAVGTTVVRALESAAGNDGRVNPGIAETAIFIRPGYRFRVVDALVTNFHLPRSTLLMLVSAFAGHERMMAAYRHAVEQQYRFYSYGDAMAITAAKGEE